MLAFTNRVPQHGAIFKATDSKIYGKKMPMASLRGSPIQYKNVITSLSALDDDNESFKLDIVKSDLLREEQRRDMSDLGNLDQALSASSHERQLHCKFSCSYSHRHKHTKDRS